MKSPALLHEVLGLDRRVWSLAAARLVVTGGFSMVMPFLAIHLAVDRRVPAVTIGFIWTLAGAASAVMQWVAGELADRFGRRPLMTASMFLRAANLAGMGVATAIEASVPVIGALCVSNAVLRAFFDPVASAMVADLAPPERRVAAYSLQRVGINMGWAAGPAAAALAGGHAYSELFYWSVPVTLLSAFAVAAIAEPARVARAPSETRARDLVAFLGDRAFVRFLAASVAFFVLQVQLYQTLSIYAARFLGLSRAAVGALYTLNGLLVVALQLPAVALIARIGARRALVLGSLGYAASYTAVGLSGGLGSLLACVVAVTLSEIMSAPAQQAAVSHLAPAGRMGAYAGLFGLCQVVGQSAGPLIGTAALDAVSPRAAWFLLALFGVAAAAGYRTARGERPAIAPGADVGTPT